MGVAKNDQNLHGGLIVHALHTVINENKTT
jgi:hypothetical protein